MEFGKLLVTALSSLGYVFIIQSPAPVNLPVDLQSASVQESVESIPILVYHHIRPQQNWSKSTWSWKMTVSPPTFEQHLQWLTKQGYTTITLDELVQIFAGTVAPPNKPVVITFDDNNANQYQNAFPLLKKHNHKAVFYLVANRIQNESFITPEQIKEMVAAGMDIQSHTMTHANMRNITNAEIQWQLAESKRLLEEVTGTTVQHVSYPLTAHSERIRTQTQLAGYATGTIMDPRNATSKSNLFKLPRIMMTDDTVLNRVLP